MAQIKSNNVQINISLEKSSQTLTMRRKDFMFMDIT